MVYQKCNQRLIYVYKYILSTLHQYTDPITEYITGGLTLAEAQVPNRRTSTEYITGGLTLAEAQEPNQQEDSPWPKHRSLISRRTHPGRSTGAYQEPIQTE